MLKGNNYQIQAPGEEGKGSDVETFDVSFFQSRT